MKLPTESPVEAARKSGPRGDGDWPGSVPVYRKISQGCDAMAREKYVYLSEDHVQAMADLGSGHEERMKWRLAWMCTYGYIK